MTFNAGNKVAASDLDQILTTSSQNLGAIQTAAAITFTSTAQDLTGTSLTFSTVYANTKAMIWGTFDLQGTGTSDIGIGTAVLDGTTLPSGEAHYIGNGRATVFQQWIATLASPGAHTLKLQGKNNNNTATLSSFPAHTKWHMLVLGP